MEAEFRCHSCGTEVNSHTRRCANCYVALEAASRAPSPLRAAPSATPVSGQLALVSAPVDEVYRLSVGVRCPACETTVMPVTGWCSYCMEPLPVDGSPASSSSPASRTAKTSHGRVIAGPWPARPAGLALATWQQRAVASLIDAAVFVPVLVALAFSVTIAIVALVVAAAFTAWQTSVLQGRTGQTIGKKRVGISLVAESDMAPIGARRALLRQLAHAIDVALLGVGYLWPLWDAKHQTLADRLLATVVVVD